VERLGKINGGRGDDGGSSTLARGGLYGDIKPSSPPPSHDISGLMGDSGMQHHYSYSGLAGGGGRGTDIGLISSGGFGGARHHLTPYSPYMHPDIDYATSNALFHSASMFKAAAVSRIRTKSHSSSGM